MTLFTDLKAEQDAEGIFDLVIDEERRDAATIDGLEAALIVSLLSDRRARPDEVADVLRRRGWICNLVAEVAGDNHGSGIWLYEQRRLTASDVNGVRQEGEQSLEWMVDEGFAGAVSARAEADGAGRLARIFITLKEPGGAIVTRVFQLIDATRQGVLARI